jgi:hypothetical protein
MEKGEMEPVKICIGNMEGLAWSNFTQNGNGNLGSFLLNPDLL